MARTLPLIIEKARLYPEGPEKDAFVKAIAIHLKNHTELEPRFGV